MAQGPESDNRPWVRFDGTVEPGEDEGRPHPSIGQGSALPLTSG
jgi:hypothetical protein